MNIFGFGGTICKGRDGQEAIKSGDTTKGSLWASANLAVYNFFKKEPEFYNVIAYGKLAEVMLRANAGDQITCAGRIETYEYQNKGGQTIRGVKFICSQFDLPRGANAAASKPTQHEPPPGEHDSQFDEPPF
jgi:single-stranded DNA-binding protein